MKDKIKKIFHILTREKYPPQKVVAVLFEDEQSFLSAVRLMAKDIKNLEAVTPYPVHGLEEMLNIKRSWIPWVTLIFGLMGLAGGFLLTWWTSVISWPLIIGGKPFFSLPAFIPVIFECTILFSALATVASLFCACDLPKVDPPVLDPDLTSHKFALYCPAQDVEKMKDQFKRYKLNNIKVSVF